MKRHGLWWITWANKLLDWRYGKERQDRIISVGYIPTIIGLGHCLVGERNVGRL